MSVSRGLHALQVAETNVCLEVCVCVCARVHVSDWAPSCHVLFLPKRRQRWYQIDSPWVRNNIARLYERVLFSHGRMLKTREKGKKAAERSLRNISVEENCSRNCQVAKNQNASRKETLGCNKLSVWLNTVIQESKSTSRFTTNNCLWGVYVPFDSSAMSTSVVMKKKDPSLFLFAFFGKRRCVFV